MDTRPAPRRRPRWLAAGLTAALAGGSAPAQSPAARILPPRPVAAEAAPAVARGGPPDAPFDLTAAYAGRPDGPVSDPYGAPVPAHPKPLFNTTWPGLKGLVGGSQPSVPPPTAPASKPVSVGDWNPQPGSSNPTVYAGPPAYRWFGWGTTTPGANQFAPNGQYPQGSANWYAQTGATPGAFPVPVVNPFRPSPGADAPLYAGSGAADVPPPAPLATRLPPRDTGSGPGPASWRPPEPSPVMLPFPTREGPNGPPPIAQTSPFGPATAAGGFAPPPTPRLPTGPGSPSITFTSEFPTGSAPSEPRWQPASAPVSAGSEGARATPPATHRTVPDAVVQASAVTATPTPTQADAEALIRTACNGMVGGIQCRGDGPGRLVVGFVAPSEAHARAAADAVSKLPQLRGYDVRFEARLPGR